LHAVEEGVSDQDRRDSEEQAKMLAEMVGSLLRLEKQKQGARRIRNRKEKAEIGSEKVEAPEERGSRGNGEGT